MKKNLKLFLILLYILSLSNCHNQNDDILALFIKIPDQLQFMGSNVGSGQIILEAKYRVSGTNAHLVENLLHNNYEMIKLKFACCGWESHSNGEIEITDKFNNKYGKFYDYNYISISMYSQETLINDRSQWKEIPYFYVVVKVLKI